MLVCLHEEEGVSTSALLDILVVATIRHYKKKDLQVLYRRRTPHLLHEIRHHLGMTNPYQLTQVQRLTTRSNRHKHNTTTAMSATHMWCRLDIMRATLTEHMETWDHRTTQLMGIQYLPDLQFRIKRHNHVSLLLNRKKYSID